MTDHKDMDLELVRPDLLPPQIRQLVRVIGLPDTITLLQARGGTFLRIPINPHGSQLAGIIGLDSAQKLCTAMPHKKIELPKADKIMLQLRNIAVRNSRKTLSASEVARKFRLTRRHVINLTSDDADDQTGDLFDAAPPRKGETFH